MRVTKYVLPVVAGAMSGIIIMTLGEGGIHHIYPLPVGIDIHDTHALSVAIGQMPPGAFILLLLSYAAGSFAAGAIATLVSGCTVAIPAFVVGCALTLAALFNLITIQHPLWFCILNLLCYVPFAHLGYLAVRNRNIPHNKVV